jgi:hypothetical protein
VITYGGQPVFHQRVTHERVLLGSHRVGHHADGLDDDRCRSRSTCPSAHLTYSVDQAYDIDAIRDDFKKRDIKAVIPQKSNRKVMIRYSKRLYRQRNCIKRDRALGDRSRRRHYDVVPLCEEVTQITSRYPI